MSQTQRGALVVLGLTDLHLGVPRIVSADGSANSQFISCHALAIQSEKAD